MYRRWQWMISINDYAMVWQQPNSISDWEPAYINIPLHRQLYFKLKTLQHHQLPDSLSGYSHWHCLFIYRFLTNSYALTGHVARRGGQKQINCPKLEGYFLSACVWQSFCSHPWKFTQQLIDISTLAWCEILPNITHKVRNKNVLRRKSLVLKK